MWSPLDQCLWSLTTQVWSYIRGWGEDGGGGRGEGSYSIILPRVATLEVHMEQKSLRRLLRHSLFSLISEKDSLLSGHVWDYQSASLFILGEDFEVETNLHSLNFWSMEGHLHSVHYNGKTTLHWTEYYNRKGTTLKGISKATTLKEIPFSPSVRWGREVHCFSLTPHAWNDKL